MNGGKVLNSLSCATEPGCTKELCLTPAWKQEDIKTPNKIPKVMIQKYEILTENVYSMQKDMLAASVRLKKHQIHSEHQPNKDLLQSPLNLADEESKNIYSQPRRIKELLQSPLHSDMLAASIRLKKESSMESPLHRKMRSSSIINQEDSKSLHSQPCRAKKLFQSPLPRGNSSTSTPFQDQSKKIHPEVHNNMDLLESPRNISYADSKILYSEPRRIKEMIQSPLHRDMRSSIMLLEKASQGVHSEPRRTKELLYSKCLKSVRPVRLKFDKQDMDKIVERIATYLQQVTAFQGISKQNIHQMGLQDFINIIGHLLTYTGIPLKPLDKSNYINETINAMEQLNYPHKVRKSWLMMPSASLQHVVKMIDFLMDFAPV